MSLIQFQQVGTGIYVKDKWPQEIVISDTVLQFPGLAHIQRARCGEPRVGEVVKIGCTNGWARYHLTHLDHVRGLFTAKLIDSEYGE